MGSDGDPLEHIAIGNVVPFSTPSTEPRPEAEEADAPEAGPEGEVEASLEPEEELLEGAPKRPPSIDLLEAAARIVTGLISIALSSLSEAIASSIQTDAAPALEEEAETEPAPPPGPDPIAIAVGATLGLALEAGRVISEVAADVSRRTERLLSWIPVPGIARMPMNAASDRLSSLNERWRDEQPAAEDIATAFAGSLVPQIVEAALDQIDLTDLVLERVDLARVVDGIDIDRIVERIDLDEVIAGIDIGAIIDRVDVGAVIEHVDIDRIAERIDLDRVLERVDLDRIVERIDIAKVVDRIPLDGIVARLDLEAIVHRLDLGAIAQEVIEEIDLPDIIRESSGAMASDTVQGIRLQSMDADRLVARAVDRVLRRRERHTEALTATPPEDGDGT